MGSRLLAVKPVDRQAQTLSPPRTSDVLPLSLVLDSGPTQGKAWGQGPYTLQLPPKPKGSEPPRADGDTDGGSATPPCTALRGPSPKP